VGTGYSIHISHSPSVKGRSDHRSHERHEIRHTCLRKSSQANCGKLASQSPFGAVAQSGERRLCTAEVRGSNPLGSTPKM
jgi:hypothetical protein